MNKPEIQKARLDFGQTPDEQIGRAVQTHLIVSQGVCSQWNCEVSLSALLNAYAYVARSHGQEAAAIVALRAMADLMERNELGEASTTH